MNKTEYIILDENYDRVQAVGNLQEARALAEHRAKDTPGEQFFIATITHRIKAVIKTEWDE
jgi:hypothetical protein